MTPGQLYKELNYVNHSREKRAHYAQLLIAQPILMKEVLDILFMVDDELSNRAGWLAEFATKNDISIIYPHLDYFIDLMDTVYQDSALRPCAKICERLVLSYYKDKNALTQKHLTQKHRTKMIETGFDWLLTDQKVAVKAYTMTTLFYLGTDTDWVHVELERIMRDGYASGSAAFKARCRHMKILLDKYRAQQA